MAVSGVEAAQDHLARVGAIVAVGILQEKQFALAADEDAAVEELEADRQVQSVGEHLHPVGFPSRSVSSRMMS
jgi:hypothetical protein